MPKKKKPVAAAPPVLERRLHLTGEERQEVKAIAGRIDELKGLIAAASKQVGDLRAQIEIHKQELKACAAQRQALLYQEQKPDALL